MLLPVSMFQALTLGERYTLPTGYLLIYASSTEEIAFAMEIIVASVEYDHF
jgi:hypothetical protein